MITTHQGRPNSLAGRLLSSQHSPPSWHGVVVLRMVRSTKQAHLSPFTDQLLNGTGFLNIALLPILHNLRHIFVITLVPRGQLLLEGFSQISKGEQKLLQTGRAETCGKVTRSRKDAERKR